jgi:ribosome-associated protein
MTRFMTSTSTSLPPTAGAAKKDTQRLQRAIVDGLEDVKAQDIVVFDTEHLSALFERVIVASGTSNRQTKALAASVRDAVKAAGFPHPRTEGESNGEWIIVDCGQAVVHIMQPNFRQYYHLEELWGEKPVRLKLGSAKPLPKASTPAKEEATGKPAGSLRRSSAAKKGVQEAFPSKAEVKKAQARTAAKTATKGAAKTTAKEPARAPARSAATTGVKSDAKTGVKTDIKTGIKPATKTPTKTPTRKLVVGKPPAKRAAAPKR